MEILQTIVENICTDVLTSYIEYQYNETTAQKVKDLLKTFYDARLQIEQNQADKDAPKKLKIINTTQYYMDVLSELDNIYLKAHDKFVYEVNTLIQLFSMFVIAETSISKDIEYNKLLEAIPKETLNELPKKLTKTRDIKKQTKALSSLDFVLSEPFVSDLNRHVDNATYQYAVMYFCIVSLDAVKDNNKLDVKIHFDNMLDIQEYEYFKECARVLFDFGDARLNKKEFHATKFYKLYSKFIELDQVITQADATPFKKAVKVEHTALCNLLKEQRAKASDLIMECSQELFKQGWWYGDE